MGSGAALPHFGRDGKGGDTCFFCPFDKFFGHFFLFFAPMSPDFAHCVTCFWNIQNPRYGNCHTCHTGVAASGMYSWLGHIYWWCDDVTDEQMSPKAGVIRMRMMTLMTLMTGKRSKFWRNSADGSVALWRHSSLPASGDHLPAVEL